MLGYKVPTHLIKAKIDKMYALQEKQEMYSAGMNDIIESIEALGEEELDSNWHTGTPTTEGWYLVRTVDTEHPFDSLKFADGKWLDYGFDSYEFEECRNDYVLKWQKITPYEGEVNG